MTGEISYTGRKLRWEFSLYTSDRKLLAQKCFYTKMQAIKASQKMMREIKAMTMVRVYRQNMIDYKDIRSAA